MIIEHPWVLMLFFALIPFIWWLNQQPNSHAIKFPKTTSLMQVASPKLQRLLTMTRRMEWIILILIILTIAQPKWVTSEKYASKDGIDIVALLDTSGSMNAEDFKPDNRMEVAKSTLKRFIRKRPNDRIGLIIFGTDAYTKTPLTFDHSILQYHLNQTKVGEAGEGTAIGLAIATGIHRLSHSNSPSKVMILITDGVNNAGQINPLSATTLAANQNIKIYTIGIGDKKGAPIPIYHPTYGKRYARYPNGQLVLTEFDDQILKTIAQTTNALYFNAKNTDQLTDIFKQIDSLEKTEIKTKNITQTMDLFPYLIAMIIVILILKEVIVSTRLVGVRS